MNYTYRLDDGYKHSDGVGTYIGIQFSDEWARPRKGQELRLNKFSSAIWRVIRVDPPSNPTGQSNVIYVEKVRNR